MLVEERPITEIKPYDKHPRHNDSGIDAVAASLQDFGFRPPIVVDEEGVIVVGHRCLLPLSLSWSCPCYE